MKTDYKFWYITRDDNGFIIKAGIRYYEGDITTENEKDLRTLENRLVTRYRRLAKLRTEIYTTAELGQIKDDDELRVFINGELKKDKTRTPVNEQKETSLSVLRNLTIK